MRAALVLLSLWVLASCSGKQNQPEDLASLPSSGGSAAPPPPPENKMETRYFYPYATKRDPFVPLVGGVFQAGSGDKSDLAEGELTNLELKGIMRDRRGKVALISSNSGEPYTLRAGRVYDRKNRIVSGVSGIIKESSVVLITQNRTIREIPLRNASSGIPSSQ